MKKIIIAAVLLVHIILVKAQKDSTSINEIEIQGKILNLPYKKVTENITVISKKELEKSPSKSIEEVLAQYAGFDIRKRGGNGVQADITLLGSSFEQVLILINGIRMNDSQTGHNSMNIPIDLGSVERIEVIKGPAARRFGQNAFAGVINIITKTTDEKNIKISGSGGDFSTYSLGASAQLGNKKFSHFLQANTTYSDGYRYNTDYKINNIYYQNTYQLENGAINFQAGIQEKKFGANGFYASPAAIDQYEETQASIVSLALDKKFEKFHLNSNIYWRRGQDEYLYSRQKPEIYRNLHLGNNVGGQVSADYQSSLGTTGLGVELRKEYLVSNNLGNRARFVTQVFFEHHFSFLEDQLKISPGISWANYNEQGSFFYPGVDVGFDFNENNKIYGNVSKVNRVPTFTDLYYASKTETGNPNLKPENAISSEIGYRYQKNSLVGKMSGFYRSTENSIDWVKKNAADIWMAENIGKIDTKGVEVEVSKQFNSLFKSFSVSYVFLDSKVSQPENLISRYVAENLKHQLILKSEQKFLKNITNEIIYRYTERVTTGSSQLLDDKLSYQLKNLNVYVLVNNVTNTNYTESFGIPLPKRWFHIGFTYNIGL